MNLTVDYSASTVEIHVFFVSLGNAFDQHAAEWEEVEVVEHTVETFNTIHEMMESANENVPDADTAGIQSDASSKQTDFIEDTMSLITTVAVANVGHLADNETFTATIGDISIFAQTVSPQTDSQSNSTEISIPGSEATITIPGALCGASDLCVVVFIAMGSDVTTAFDHFDVNQDGTGLISDVYTINIDRSTNDRRRRLQGDDFSSLDTCSPFFFTIPISSNVRFSNDDDVDAGERTLTVPVCQFWDTITETWSQTGCWLSSYTNSSMTCSCTHLTSFSGAAENFIPSANVKAIWNWRALTIENMMDHPTVFLSILGALCLFISICFTTPDRYNRPLIAFEDSIFESFRKLRGKSLKYTSLELTEIKYLESILPPNNKMMIGTGIRRVCSGAICAMMKLHWKLFILYLKNEHTLFSVFQRSAGTNYTVRQRVSCFFVYLCTLIAISAIFYGVNQQGVSIITASATMSLVAVIPGKIFKKLFKKSKPKIVESQKINQMIFHLKPDLDLIASNRPPSYQRLIDIVSNTKDNVKMQMVRRVQTSYSVEQSGEQDGVDWNQMTLVNQIRNRLLDETYPYPHGMKKITWLLLSAWCLAMIIIALQYGIQFDLLYDIVDGQPLPSCWQNNFRETLNSRFTEIFIEDRQNSVQTDYGLDYVTDSRAWLISVCESLAFSILLWQPFMIWLFTWLKLWAFTHNLKLDGGIVNLYRLMGKVFRCRCCGFLDSVKRRRQNKGTESERGAERDNDHQADAEEVALKIRDSSEPLQQRSKSEIKNFRITDIADRPLDIYQFYGSRELLVNDVNTDVFDQDFPTEESEVYTDFTDAHRRPGLEQNEIKPLDVVLEINDEITSEDEETEDEETDSDELVQEDQEQEQFFVHGPNVNNGKETEDEETDSEELVQEDREQEQFFVHGPNVSNGKEERKMEDEKV